MQAKRQNVQKRISELNSSCSSGDPDSMPKHQWFQSIDEVFRYWTFDSLEVRGWPSQFDPFGMTSKWASWDC